METYELELQPGTEVTDQIETRQVLEATWLIVIAHDRATAVETARRLYATMVSGVSIDSLLKNSTGRSRIAGRIVERVNIMLGSIQIAGAILIRTHQYSENRLVAREGSKERVLVATRIVAEHPDVQDIALRLVREIQDLF